MREFIHAVCYCYQLCRLRRPEWVREWNDDQKMPMMYNMQRHLWVGYEDTRSVTEKVGPFVIYTNQ